MTPSLAFLVCHGLRWLPTGLLLPIMVLVLLERGLDLTEVGFVFAVYGAVTSLLELPTGGLADAIGRKPVLLAGTVFDAGFAAGLLFGETLWHFLAAAALGAIGRALLSGPLEAWYVDTARSADPTIALRPALSAAGVVEALALAGGALLSAVIPLVSAGLALDGPASLLSLPIIAALVAQGASFAAVLVLIGEERCPDGQRRMLEDVPAIVAGGVQLALRHRDLRLIFAGTFIAVAAMVTVEVLWQPRFADLLGGADTAAQVNGFLVAALSVAAAVGSWAANHLPAALARHAPRAAASVALASAAALAGLAAATVFALAAVAFLSLYATTAAFSVIRSELLHDRVSAEWRATMVSSLSMSQQAANLVASLTLVRLADVAGIRLVWALGAGLFLLQAALIALIRPFSPQREEVSCRAARDEHRSSMSAHAVSLTFRRPPRSARLGTMRPGPPS